MKTILIALAALSLTATAADAQRTRHVTAQGSDWGYFLYETGFPSAMRDEQGEVVITLMTRDGRPVAEADRSDAAGVAQALCRQAGRQFNTRWPAQWLRNGGLSFDGACTPW
ncbi:MAG: hypothetical protein ACK4GT_17300 [Pararhodobacter sp.]